MNESFKLIECPRDAMQGWANWIPTEKKIAYIQKLLEVGFDTIDFASFVSHIAVPQMKDSAEVSSEIASPLNSKLLAIVLNARGTEQAVGYSNISQVGYPLSISETFQSRNSGKSIKESFEVLKDIKQIADRENRELVVYISMGFGNPYGETYNIPLLIDFIGQLQTIISPHILSVADTVGTATPDQVLKTLSKVNTEFSGMEIGAHLHSNPKYAAEKIHAVIESGVRRLDHAILGFGGCPFAEDDLIGNIDTETVLSVLKQKDINADIDLEAFFECIEIARTVFV